MNTLTSLASQSLSKLLAFVVASPKRAAILVVAILALRSLGGSDDSERDERLVGTWRHTDAYADSFSGFSAAVDDVLALAADGVFFEGGSAAAGDTGNSFVSDGSLSPSGEWRTGDGTLFIRPHGETSWYEVGTYSLTDDGSAMLLRYANGGKKIWNRN